MLLIKCFYFSIFERIQFYFQTSDFDPNTNVTEAGIDDFYIFNASELGLESPENKLQIYPNPTSSLIKIKGLSARVEYQVLTMQGELMMSDFVSLENNFIDVQELATGIYILRIGNSILKIIKQND